MLPLLENSWDNLNETMENAAPSPQKSPSNLLEKGNRKTVVIAKYRSKSR